MRLAKRRLGIVVLLLGAAVAIWMVAGAAPGPTEAVTWTQSDIALGQPAYYQDPIEEVSLTLTAGGFAPAELRPHGKKFLLSLDNRTEVKELTLRLTGADGVQIRELRIRGGGGGGGDWSELFELATGTYTLSEASHRDWSCTIVLQ